MKSIDPKSLNIVFMGTPDFAVASLDALLTNGYKIKGVVTATDKPAGRGRKIHESAVKKYAVKNNLALIQPKNLKSEEFLEKLEALKSDLIIVVAFRMLPKAVWQMPTMGTFNLHASLLPEYRGAAPINWAVINGEKTTGATTFFIDDKIDTGEIILQEALDIGELETAGELHDRLMNMGAQLVVKTVNLIAKGNYELQKQPLDTCLKEAPKLHRENCKINWSAPLEKIHDQIRGLSPFPTAWTTLIENNQETMVKIYAAEILKADHSHETGAVVATKNEIKVAVKGGYIMVKEMQLPGKRKMNVKDILNGHKFDKNAHMR